ncbi:hypothetical protein E2320_016783, partial [Naja naja]
FKKLLLLFNQVQKKSEGVVFCPSNISFEGEVCHLQ